MNNLWFIAKKYGWGWQPSSWQGWTVTLFYIVFNIYFFFKLFKNFHSITETLVNFVPEFVISTIILIAICYVTGEKPYWRWGK